MQFQVPQFIDVEDKIVGPFTLKQFLYLAGAGAVAFITFFMFATWLWLVVTFVAAAVAIVLAFVKYNGRPMIVMLGAIFKYIWQPKLYLWRHEASQKAAFSNVEIEKLPKSSGQTKNPLKNLLLKLNTSRGAVAGREKSSPEATQAAVKNKLKSRQEARAKNAF